jgi:Ca-activated chloride channel family protein
VSGATRRFRDGGFRMVPRLRRAVRAGVALAAMASVAAAAAAAVDVAIASPSPLEPAFGPILIEVEVRSPSPLKYVDFFVDGQRAGRVERAPWRLEFDVGQANVAHTFRAVAADITGGSGEASLSTPRIDVNDSFDVELQQLFASVTNRAGTPVTGLPQGAFEIVNDRGSREQIVTFGAGDLPISSVLLLDSSASMAGEPLAAALEGVKEFVERTKPEDETMVAFFADRLLGATTFSRDDAALQRALGDVRATGGTAVNDHLYYALNRLQPRLGRRVVVLLSDGLDVSSLLDMERVLWRARRSQAMIYWLRLGATGRGNEAPLYTTVWRDSVANEAGYEALVQAVQESGGRIVDINSVADIDDAFRRVIEELRAQYVLGFHPKDARNDGSWRSLRLRVDGDGLTVRTRAGYID